MDEPKTKDAPKQAVRPLTVRGMNALLDKIIQDTADGTCPVENANAIAKLAAQKNQLLRTALDAMRLQHDLGAAVIEDPVALVLGERAAEDEAD